MLEAKKQLKNRRWNFTDCELEVIIDKTDRQKEYHLAASVLALRTK